MTIAIAVVPTGLLMRLTRDPLHLRPPAQGNWTPTRQHERSVDAAHKVFDLGKSGLLDTYRGVLAGGVPIDDGMMVWLTVAPSGAVTGAVVRTSTSSNPELDAAVVKTMMGWTFSPINGGEVSADYPVIFARDERFHGGDRLAQPILVERGDDERGGRVAGIRAPWRGDSFRPAPRSA